MSMKPPPSQLDLIPEPEGVVISKSKLIAGWQCQKLFWHSAFDNSAVPPPDKIKRFKFAQGREVGELARAMFPSGVKLPLRRNAHRAFLATTAALPERKPLFEAAGLHKGAFALADILLPTDDGKWDLIEVKSSTSTKAIHLVDAAYQYFVFAGSGIPIDKVYIMHIDTNYVRQGDIDPQGVFTKSDVTEKVALLQPEIETCFKQLSGVSREPTSPDIPVGEHCFSPYRCPMFDTCWGKIENHHILNLHRGRKLALELLKENVRSILAIPEDVDLSDAQRIQRHVLKSKQAHVDLEGIEKFLHSLTYPLFYLDLESFQTAVPVFDGIKPFEQIPFQFSLHIEREPGAEMEHHGFIASGREDSRTELFNKLRPLLEGKGSILVYNVDFERQRFQEADLPSDWVNTIVDRFNDLHAPFASFLYYHASQQGSTSMKQVLPAITNLHYDELDIYDGRLASLEFIRTHIAAENLNPAEREKVRRQLGLYCKRDTEGMAAIVASFRHHLAHRNY